jgi:rsbT co-antagonist protein RsbR
MTITSETLRTFILANAEEMTEKWLSFRKSEGDISIYSNHQPQQHVHELREHNLQLIHFIANKLVDNGTRIFEAWGMELGEKRARFHIPINKSMEQFAIFRKVFWSYFEQFLDEQEKTAPYKKIMEWGRIINNAFDEMIQQFTNAYFIFTTNRLKAQEEMIDELSTPVISIADGIAVLPLIGDIDTHRARTLMEHALKESQEKEVNCLLIDLSGVFMVDTMVAQELFKIISALNLTGVDVSLTGMRPELANSAVRLGIRFDQVSIYNNLEQALKEIGIVRN